VQKPKHVRELLVNPTGAKTKKGEMFPNGSVLVMEIYNAKKDADGNAIKRPDGKNAKDNLAKFYVMEKGAGWGKNAPKGLQNGDWIFTAFSPDGKPIKVDYTKCRACHLPLTGKDFVHRYDEYFDKRGH
jgi:hemoglobin